MEIKHIKEYVQKTANIDLLDMNRKRETVDTKAVFVRLCRKLVKNRHGNKISYSLIGKHLNMKHCNVIHLNKKVFDSAMQYSLEAKELYDGFFLHDYDFNEMIQLEQKYKLLKDEYVSIKIDYNKLDKKFNAKNYTNKIKALVNSVPKDRIDLLEERLIPIVKMLNNARFN